MTQGATLTWGGIAYVNPGVPGSGPHATQIDVQNLAVDNRADPFQVVALRQLAEECQEYDVPRPATRLALSIAESAYHGAPSLPILGVATEDAGITVEVESSQTGRDVLFAIPDHGASAFLVARGPEGFRRTGYVIDIDVATDLARWVNGRHARFPEQAIAPGHADERVP